MRNDMDGDEGESSRFFFCIGERHLSSFVPLFIFYISRISSSQPPIHCIQTVSIKLLARSKDNEYR